MIYREGTRHRTRGAGTKSTTERHLLVDLHFDTNVTQTEVTKQIEYSNTRRVEFWL